MAGMEPPLPIPNRKRSLSFSSTTLAPSTSSQISGNLSSSNGGLSEKMSILALGGGQEYLGIYHDDFLHLNVNSGLDALPFLDMCDLDQVDLLLVTHFHMDHMACLPYLTQHTNFSGRVFMTHPTKAVMRMLLLDYVRKHQDEVLYSEEDLKYCLEKCEVVDTHQTFEVNGIGFQAYTAGHVLGACMFMVQIAGVNVLYTGDYSTEEDRHLMSAEVPSISPDVLIVESTFGITDHEKRENREHKFTSAVEDIASKKGGCCLVPVFALGRAQELLLILDEYWQAHQHLQHIPIYYANGMSSKAVRVYQTYINMMNDHIRAKQLEQPFAFRHIKAMPSNSRQELSGPCVVMATPGTLEGGLSGRLLGQWCESNRNGVILTGFLPEGTPAKELTRIGRDKLFESEGVRHELNCVVHEMSFAAHVDFSNNYDFISRVRPSNIVLVHGEKKTMEELQRALVRKIMDWPQDERPSVYAPANASLVTHPVTKLEKVHGMINIRFQRSKRAKAVGKLAEDTLSAGVVNAMLVSKDYELTLVSPEDLNAYAPLHLSGLSQRLHVPFSCRPNVLVAVLQTLFTDVAVTSRDTQPDTANGGGSESSKEQLPELTIEVSSCVRVISDTETLPGAIVLEWDATPASDLIADAIVAAAMHAQTSPQTLLAYDQIPIQPDRPTAIPVTNTTNPVRKAQKGKIVKKNSKVEEVEPVEELVPEVDLSDAMAASSALQRELLLKLCDFLEMKFDIVKLVNIGNDECEDPLNGFNWNGIYGHQLEELASFQSMSPSDDSVLKGNWALQVSEPVIRGNVSNLNGCSHASCLVRWVREQGIVVDPMPSTSSDSSLMDLSPIDGLTAVAADTPELAAWKVKQSQLEKSIETTLTRALVALGPLRADARR